MKDIKDIKCDVYVAFDEKGCKEKLKVPDGYYYCTRKINHKGKHHAHGDVRDCFARWD